MAYETSRWYKYVFWRELIELLATELSKQAIEFANWLLASLLVGRVYIPFK